MDTIFSVWIAIKVFLLLHWRQHKYLRFAAWPKTSFSNARYCRLLDEKR